MENAKRKRGRPPKCKAMEFEGMTYEGAINTPHDDDHTDELADLRKKFTAIDTLIAKMKHRDELELVYKEYQGKSGWSQSRFKKKNSATIEDYEATVKYIKEHTAFLIKRETAKKYTRQVRSYINEEHNRREREKYRQKKLTQQRKKDTLE